MRWPLSCAMIVKIQLHVSSKGFGLPCRRCLLYSMIHWEGLTWMHSQLDSSSLSLVCCMMVAWTWLPLCCVYSILRTTRGLHSILWSMCLLIPELYHHPSRYHTQSIVPYLTILLPVSCPNCSFVLWTKYYSILMIYSRLRQYWSTHWLIIHICFPIFIILLPIFHHSSAPLKK